MVDCDLGVTALPSECPPHLCFSKCAPIPAVKEILPVRAARSAASAPPLLPLLLPRAGWRESAWAALLHAPIKKPPISQSAPVYLTSVDVITPPPPHNNNIGELAGLSTLLPQIDAADKDSFSTFKNLLLVNFTKRIQDKPMKNVHVQ